ncbi:hypothetical protein [Lysinibacillus xylanilyticus]|uniref:Uncharacterized protein n=1 Tax=Lysinibacillus xylanilyticus TaxID=582475 RepID=A0A2M9PXS0_9BACI|nr:hypothetical protein [Lysinibacillus xylanilyticus]PJO40621.1 hypothetical protein CWD94_27120 [Lysinibacillus xylanilyticus]
MLDESHVDDLFSDFIRSGNAGSDDIKQIYETLPYLTQDQMHSLSLLSALAVKYNSDVLRDIVDTVTEQSKGNRRTGFRFTRLIESHSLYKHFNGYRASARLDGDKDG